LIVRRIILVVVVAGLIAGGFLAFRSHQNQPPFYRALRQSRSHRIVEGRLAGLDWAPQPDYSRGTGSTDDAQLLEAAAQALHDEKAQPSAEALHDAALARVVTTGLKDAADSMERAARSSGTRASLWSDAAALRIEEWRISADSRLILEALALADRAIALDASLSEAHFNRALALEKLGLRQSAIRSYRRAALQDRISWHGETQSRIQSLHQPTRAALWSEEESGLQAAATNNDRATVDRIVRAFPQQVRTWAEGECLASWSDAIRSGKTAEAERLLRSARLTGESLVSFNGESLLLHAVTAIEQAHSNAARIAALAKAHDIYRRGRIAFSKGQNADGARDLTASARLFTTSRSPMADVASYYAASAAYEAGDRDSVLGTLRELRERIPSGHRALQAHIDWEMGTILGAQADLYDAVTSYNRALATFERLNETESIAQMRTMIAKSLSLMGDSAEAARVRQQAIEVASDSGNDRLLEFVLGEVAADELLAKRWDTARALQELAIGDVKVTNPRRRFDILLWHALITKPVRLTSLGATLALIPDAHAHAEAEDDLHFAEAIRVRDEDPRAAVRLLTGCIAFTQTPGGRGWMLPYLYLERARGLKKAGQTDEAISDLLHSIDFFERRRSSIELRDYRDAYVGTVTDAFKELMQLYLDRGDEQSVVALGERRRGRIVLDSMGAKARPLDPSEIASRLEPETRLLVYTTVGDTVLVTSIAHDTVSIRRLPLNAQWIAAKSTTLRAAIEGSSRSSADASIKALSDLLAPDFAGQTRVVVVADAPLNDVSFAVLRESDGRYVIEETTIVRAPSASAYVHASARYRSPSSSSSALLALADPAFSSTTFPTLPRLPQAAAEAAEIAPMYQHSTALVGERATFENLEHLVRRSNVIHLAAHTITNTRDASLSQLILAADATSSGACSVRRVARMQLGAGSTVVLAGCRTAVGDGGNGDLRDFANAFLAAGATNVVATLWDVQDSATRELSVRFHRHLLEGLPAEAALRQSQIDMLRATDPALNSPRSWASFEIYTSEAPE
jgi:CHAT domain-containing protein/tetratricopeptide (TPR) repeat protein